MVNGCDRLVVRPFEPRTALGFRLSRGRDSRNAHLVDGFVTVARAVAGSMLRDTAADLPPPEPARAGGGRRRA